MNRRTLSKCVDHGRDSIFAVTVCSLSQMHML